MTVVKKMFKWVHLPMARPSSSLTPGVLRNSSRTYIPNNSLYNIMYSHIRLQCTWVSVWACAAYTPHYTFAVVYSYLGKCKWTARHIMHACFVSMHACMHATKYLCKSATRELMYVLYYMLVCIIYLSKTSLSSCGSTRSVIALPRSSAPHVSNCPSAATVT
jgi:hypothetical protein